MWPLKIAGYLLSGYIVSSVAEPEPVERPLFGGAGAQAFRPGSGSGYENSYKMLQKALNLSSKI
jgi:hypothetical protein